MQSQDEILAAWAEVTPLMRAQAGAVAAVATIAFLPVVWSAVKRLVPERNVVFARWGFSHVALALLLVVAAQFLAASVLPSEPGLSELLLASAASLLVTGVAIGTWAIRLDPDGLRVLGMRRAGTTRATVAAILAYVATLPGLVGVMFVWTWILESAGHEPRTQDVAQAFAALEPGQYAVPLLIGILVQPFLEELVFRAFLQPLLVQNFREVAGVGLTSLAFAALHGTDVFLPIFVLSCLLGAVMLRTQNLWAVWALHALNNGLMFGLIHLRPDLALGGGGT
jgi:membrane protease YdiL (CAAX protease family)